MKKLIISILSIFSFISVFAQTEEATTEREHLTFKGIPIDGTPEEFGRKLEAVGFKYDRKIEGSYWYKGGSFAGYSDCEVIVKAYDNLVYEVVALLPTQYRWIHLYNGYDTLVSSLKKKYGEPFYQKEEFVSTPIYRDLDDDNDKYSEVEDDHCQYYTAFVDPDRAGLIHIEIKQACRVGLHYIDRYNESLKNKSVENDL